MKRALISVYNKHKKLIDFVHFLHRKKYQIISTGGTYQYFIENGLSHVKEISKITSFPEILDGRVKTIHPLIYGGILANRNIKQHINSAKKHNIHFIDIVFIECYPFIKKYEDHHDNIRSLIEFIDIGGISLLRAAAKNFFHVTSMIDDRDFELVKNEINFHGSTSLQLRKKLAGKVFNFTSYYDSIISKFFLKEEKFPIYLHESYKKKMELRYGENPHQKAFFYTKNKSYKTNFKQLYGKQLSFNNLRDMDVAWKIVSQFSEPACCIVKHSTPCGVSLGKDGLEAFRKTYETDPVSSFGGILSLNCPLSLELAEKINQIFIELVIVPHCDPHVLKIFHHKKNLRVIQINHSISEKIECVQIDGGLLVQESDSSFHENMNYQIVTENKFSQEEKKYLFFAQRVVKHVKSNAIVIAKGTQTIGISGGQTNRICAVRQAIQQAKRKKEQGLVLVSDAFFPFRDVIDEIARYGKIQSILQPGGSIRDKESIEACNEYGISMAFTGRRSFKH
ncbi:bifunctional phosphoribosylaminoimidazolecarboxamide formyltransferase/IMP cyclohydrolase [Blattabacterium cuenoti]|uniref:bifunctional phosphoribosylaminoimidazolecarboxamide formyltransferase/IMP cyclohydrolase n=1 Tax=Blattabacterium cuenoti TaxID=1653831 RepID=UPI00163B6D29|nr:bifunctional phosphoribosylaminoimidazolecarboxamide formyltransferase/IMP cyclohydrolase [Blattabacterium cuenoti]